MSCGRKLTPGLGVAVACGLWPLGAQAIPGEGATAPAPPSAGATEAPREPTPAAPGPAAGAAPTPSAPDDGAPPDGLAVEVEEEASLYEKWRNSPHTTFEFGVGLLALPAAEVCPTAPDVCEAGETSIALSLQNLYHISVFAFGAGITWAFGLRSDVAAGDEDGTLGREHSRSYFLVEGQFRYYFLRMTSWEFWTGATLGGVVINDSWDTLADREPYSDVDTVGPRAQTMSTEGFAAGLGVGFQWNFTDWGIFGSRLRYANWFLPEERELSPTGDPVSLAGRVDVFDFGLSVAARLDI